MFLSDLSSFLVEVRYFVTEQGKSQQKTLSLSSPIRLQKTRYVQDTITSKTKTLLFIREQTSSHHGTIVPLSKNSFYVRFCPVIENFALNIVISKFPYSPDKQWLKGVLLEPYMTSLYYRLPFFLPLFSKNIIT